MELSGGLFPVSWLWIFGLSLLPVYWYALRWLDLKRLQQQSNAFFGSVVFLLVLWALRTELQVGLHWHVSGMVFFTLMWGWSLALVGGALALLGEVLAGLSDWTALAPNLWLQVVLPASLTMVVLGLTRAWLPKHFFVFVFVNAFFCGGLMAAVLALAAALLLFLSGAYPWASLGNEFLVLIPLMVFPEAFINGGITTVLVGLRPQWVSSFRDEEYIDGH